MLCLFLRRKLHRRVGAACLALLALLAATPAAARVLEMRVAAVDATVATASGVDLRLDWPDGASEGALDLRVRRLEAPDYGMRFDAVRWRCALRRDGGIWRCRGGVSAAGGGPGHELAVAFSDAGLEGEFGRGERRVQVAQSAEAPGRLEILARHIPVAWMEAYLALLWEEGSFTAGRLDGRFQVDTGDTVAGRGELTIRELAFDTPDGQFAAEGLGASARIDYRGGARARLAVEGTLEGGDFLAGGFFVTLPDTPVAVALAGAQGADAGWRFDRLHWRDGRALDVRGELALAPDYGLDALALEIDSRHLASAGPRYLESVFGLVGLAGLQLNGGAHARLEMDAEGPVAAVLRLDDVGAGHPDGRFGSDGLDGTIAWSAAGERRGRLTWRGVSIHGIPILAADLDLRSVDGTLSLAEAADIEMLGGWLHLETLAITPPLRGRDTQGAFAMHLDGIDIAQLAAWLDWPPFTGRLDGRIPGVRYADGRLDFDGNLVLQLFDGTVQISHLMMERPFGVAPTLSANIAIDGLDLSALTGVFGFGEITGALDGRINGLRMVDWSVVAFDAHLHTDDAWRGRRLVSQRAVQDITAVGGGGGLIGGLQGMALGFFDDFRYRRIGIRCRLVNTVCHMGGIAPADAGSSEDGYTIVEGAGLPRLTVIGHRRLVDWPTLLERLRVATEGDGPTID
ncbi:hypothetical protein [Coralloluteibacterium thermophilus]|uniref:Dicarboxylate transport domain-containing protein n=1 Tax=Coralloluteibacterium thermophilum TaxID=2707049 RepID=A0ABV9NLL7_9GAMM